MLDLNIEFKLNQVRCYDEGDGPGNAEPYLWTVFFKVDGESAVVNTDDLSNVYLQGIPTVVPTPGNHGNLGTGSVDAGDTVSVPAIIGEYRTVLRPIPLTTPVLGRSEVGGMIGCIAVLMEEDGTPGADIARGHERLDSSVRDRLGELLGGLSLSNPEPTQEDIDRLTGQIGDAVKSAIQDGVSVIEWLGAFGNMDDEIGSAVFRFSHGQLEGSGGSPIPFSRRWRNEGDWELFGHIRATAIRRPESRCCEELKRKLAELERIVAGHEKRLVAIERGRIRQEASDTAAVRAASRARQPRRA